MQVRNPFLASAVLVYFLIALEVLVMISPLAGPFYAAYNPLLLQLAGHPGTRWLTAFFLPQLALPRDPLLLALRVAGSATLLLGVAVFLLCALQVYSAKLARRGVVLGGLYAHVRHPQYAALALAGAGLAVLWPRFLSAVLWLAMLLVYYLLAKDEERRMGMDYPDAYRRLRARTGMFLPLGLERRLRPTSGLGRLSLTLGFCAAALGLPFLLRAYSVRQLGLWSGPQGTAALAILPEDALLLRRRLGDLLALEPVRARLDPGRRYLVYLLPLDHVMQGMLANPGADWALQQRRRALSLIADRVLHPFAGQRGQEGTARRFIFLPVQDAPDAAPADLLAIRARRLPGFLVDAELRDLSLLDLRSLPEAASAWGAAAPPAF
jgi:protein-S-isoprenylcysteine O-methyltransferase Ste14